MSWPPDSVAEVGDVVFRRTQMQTPGSAAIHRCARDSTPQDTSGKRLRTVAAVSSGGAFQMVSLKISTSM